MTAAYMRNDAEIIRETQTRLYEIDGGMKALNEAELLQLILGEGTKTHLLQEVVNEILDLKSDFGLKGLTPEFLRSKVSGLTQRKAEILLAALELGKRVYTEEPAVGKVIRSPEDAAGILMDMKHLNQEHFVALYLNTKNVVIAKKTIFIGTLNASTVHPREVFHEGIMRSAASIIVAHNHPSGSPEPSGPDLEVTKRLVECGKVLGVELLDHVIIGFNKFTSLKEKGYL